MILPNVLIEVRRLNPNWLKIIAGAITIVGVTIGAVRLISPPFGEQPSYQIASTPSTSSLEKVSVAPSTRLENTLEGKVAVAPKSAEKKPNAAIAPTAPNASQPVQTSNQGLNQDLRFESKISIKTDKVAIIPEVTNNSTSSDRQRAVVNSPSITDGMTAGSTASQSGRLQLPNKDIPSPATIAAEASKSSPIEPSANLPLPSATSRSANTDILINIKVIQIQSELSSNITTDLVRYLQSPNPTCGTKIATGRS